MNDLEQKARELLAAEHEADGFREYADFVRTGIPNWAFQELGATDKCALRAIIAALRAPAPTALDCAPGELDRTAPERIWLQVDPGAGKDYRDAPFPGNHEDVTWSAESVCGLEVQYVRADLAAPAAAGVPDALLREVCEELDGVGCGACVGSDAPMEDLHGRIELYLSRNLAQHPDDAAVDRFAAAMKEKLAEARAKGRGGWENKDECSAQTLSNMLRDHVGKGDPRDVANFCMMLHQRGEVIVPAEQHHEVRISISDERGRPMTYLGGKASPPMQAVPGTLGPSEDQMDATRFRALCEDYGDRELRERMRGIIERLPVMSLSAARRDIDTLLTNACQAVPEGYMQALEVEVATLRQRAIRAHQICNMVRATALPPIDAPEVPNG